MTQHRRGAYQTTLMRRRVRSRLLASQLTASVGGQRCGLRAGGLWCRLACMPLATPTDRSLGLGRSGQAQLFWLLLQVTASPDWRQTVGTPRTP